MAASARPEVALHPFLMGPRIEPALGLARKVARVPGAPVMVRGPVGCGAEELAHYIHRIGAAPDEAFVSLRCRGVSSAALHTELFGATAEAAPDTGFARACRGTLFIEEAALLGSESQARLMALRDQARQAAARPDGGRAGPHHRGHGDRHRAARAGATVPRQSLRAALARHAVLPPLREAPAEVVPLAECLIERACGRAGRRPARLTPQARQRLRAHPWPGDCREVEAVIERALIVEPGPSLDASTIMFTEARTHSDQIGALSKTFLIAAAENGPPASLHDIERAYVVWMLQQARGNRTAASRMLGISYPTIMKKIVGYGIDYRARREQNRVRKRRVAG